MLAAEGADIIAVDICADIETNEYPARAARRPRRDRPAGREGGQRAYTEIADVRDRAALSAAIDRGVAEFGQLDIVVANAGICPLTAGLPPQAFVDAVDVDLVGVLNLVHASIKHLQAGASIIVTGSVAAFMATAMNTSGMDGGAAVPGYAFAKQVVAHYVNDLAAHAGPREHPGQRGAPDQRQHRHAAQPTDVPGVPAGPGEPDPRGRRTRLPVMQAMPIPYVEPEDISEAVLFLASDAARYVTGQQIARRRGWLLKIKRGGRLAEG